MLLIDVSQSLSSNEFFQVKSAASNVVEALIGSDRVGLISFTNTAVINSPLTTNGTNVQSMIMGLTISAGTLFDPPLDLARTYFTNTPANVMPLVVLLSDGLVEGSGEVKEANRVRGLEAAARVRGDGIRIISFAYGTDGGVNNGTNMMRVFATSEDDYFHAPDLVEIQTRYNEIAEALCRGLNPPQIAITSPSNPTELRGPASFRIETSTSDSDGFVKKVEFFNGSTSIGISTNPPFFFALTNLAAGTNSFTAVATDDDNLTNTSSPV